MNESSQETKHSRATQDQMRILFLSRAYPPVVGGIENMNYELSQWLPRYASVTTIANTQGKKFLPFFLPWIAIRSVWLARQHDVVLLGDGVLGIVGALLKVMYPQKTVVCIVHGLDITFTSKIYQTFWVKRFLPALDALIAVGNETIRVGVRHGIHEDRFVFIPNGVDTQKFLRTHTRDELAALLGESLEGKYLLVTSGRLAKRKGVAWFIRSVLPLLHENCIYIVAGDGADKHNIQAAIQESGMAKRVRMLGFTDATTRELLLNTCDLFIQPNIRVAGDMEGFGISVIEAVASELPVVASRLEGLQDAITDGKSGFLVEPENPIAYKEKIEQLLQDSGTRKNFAKQARVYVREHFDWSIIAQKYTKTLRNILQNKQR